MELINVLAAGVAAWIFGAIWYSVFAKPWMASSGVEVVDGKPANQSNPLPYIISIVGAIIVAGMMRHIFEGSGVTGLGRGLLYGAGLGAFISVPWLSANYGFAGRPFAHWAIDAGYAIGGCAAIGLVLNLF